MGANYWKKLITQSLENHYKIYVVEDDKKYTELHDTNDLAKFYSLSPRGLKYKFLIIK